ncbi:ER membrane protein DP1/Yop1 [Sorochytrium milnesiophthora]
MDQFIQYKVDAYLEHIPAIIALETRTGVPRALIAGGGTGLTIVLILFNVAGELITNLVGFVYPAYCSFKALETKGVEDDIQWLTYWVVFGFLNMIEFFTDILLHWFPFYFIVKTVLLVWLYLPQTRGAVITYNRVLRPFLIGQQARVDHEIQVLKKKASAIAMAATSSDDSTSASKKEN